MNSKIIAIGVVCLVVISGVFYFVKSGDNTETAVDPTTLKSFPVPEEPVQNNSQNNPQNNSKNNTQTTATSSTSGSTGSSAQIRNDGSTPGSTNNQPPNNAICTQDAKQCPDGSFVGRSGPNCEFAACPVVAPQPTTHTVSISGFAFGPSSVSVKKGDTVVWTNNDSAPHTVTGDGGLSSPTLSQGQKYSFTFSSSGTFSYHCGFHPSMTGGVTVAQ